ncbi:TetR/AcrR family transcriptional regulator [Ruania suaedae]|uniref:TetR/AcrR family transcriptional regulator n=1 Tax=Ruania suaedae TaxID=2897774 RepID=UPI001E595886|nr:TetR/AcrR family transcriptional regulator [Ruania suaedae]UFU03380.1 TetR/AcrR family transcriptional regulator [Ruania suaedae]
MTQLPDPLSRRDRQRQTREALIFAARSVFAEDGFHAASLDRIAREAGFSKGAVYSNFEGKSGLFLAVMDANLELAEADLDDPFERTSNPASTGKDVAEREGYPPGATQGFALATLEFIASAARDETVAAQLHERLAAVLAYYSAIAQKGRADDETLTVSEVGTLLAALDQGAGLILLAGDIAPDPDLFNAGMRRLVDPARALTERAPEA